MQAGLGGGVGFVDGLGAEVGQFDCFDIAPDHLDGVEVVGVAGESFDEQWRWVAIQAVIASR